MDNLKFLDEISNIDLEKAKFDANLIKEDLENFNLCEASVTILKGGLATINAIIEYKQKCQ